MNNKKLVKRVQFIFKKKAIMNLTKEQMRNVRGGDGTITNPGGPSTDPGCVENKPTLETISN
ncbi:hypothetical protein BCL90_3506 [Pedobacter alluvionis]|uniref:Uncharacterized protein n=1 Tax=Pedobacter alluvionis TaxID=475253 RepID=A0A497Y3X0_9SPHI|nr:hypothetical protein BCL90_3506 [Pedobacter alluvionis]